MAGVAAGGDYAANSGNQSLNYAVDSDARPLPRIDHQIAGPIFTLSRIIARQVEDGLSKTIAIGERHVPPPRPDSPPASIQISQGDTAVFCGDLADTVQRSSKESLPTGKDDPSREKFGSEHTGLSHFMMLDGHVQPIRHEIDIPTFHRLTAIADDVISSSLRFSVGRMKRSHWGKRHRGVCALGGVL